MDLGDAVLDGGSADFFGVLTIANLAIDADELAFLGVTGDRLPPSDDRRQLFKPAAWRSA